MVRNLLPWLLHKCGGIRERHVLRHEEDLADAVDVRVALLRVVEELLQGTGKAKSLLGDAG